MTPRLSDAVLDGDESEILKCYRASQREHEKNAAAILAAVGNPPLTRECSIHSGQLERFSNADSAARRRPCYRRCPACEHEADILSPRLKKWRENGLPAVYFGVRLDELEFADDEWAAIEGFNRDRIGILALLGHSGTGKTSAACAILQAKGSGLYYTRADALSELRATYTSGRGGPTGNGLKHRLIETRMLVLDEFEKADNGADGQRLLFELLDGRYREGRPTIICGNCSLSEFRQTLGTAGYSRVTEAGGRILEFAGHDRRPSGRDKYAEKVRLIRRLEKLGED